MDYYAVDPHQQRKISPYRWAHPSHHYEQSHLSASHFKVDKYTTKIRCNKDCTRMLANAQRDGRPAERRWRPLFNAAKFGWRPLLECRAVTLPRRERRWNLQGCPKLANRSQPLVGRSSPYCEFMWGRHSCLTFFPIVDTCFSCEDIARQSCAMVPRWRIFADFGSCISSEPRTAHFRPAL